MDDLGGPSAKRFRLTGDRFNGGRLPVDSLVEFELYQNAVRTMAEHDWRRDHPNQPVPTDFVDGVSLVITAIRDGSAEVLLAFEQHAVYQEYQDEAQHAVDSTILAAYGGHALPDLPDDVADDVRESLAEIGNTLEAGQSIEFYPDGGNEPPVTISIETRRAAADRLILDHFLTEPAPPSGPGVRHEPTSLVARVTVVDAERMRYELNSEQFGRVLGRYRGNPEILETLRELVNSTSHGPLTRIFGELRYRGDKPWGFWQTTSIERVEFDTTEWGRTLTSFVTLPTGWADGHGKQIASVALDAAQQLLRRVDVDRRPPSLAPTEDGGVLIEWITDGGIRSVEILEDGTMELFSMRAGDLRGEQTETINVVEAAEFANRGDAAWTP